MMRPLSQRRNIDEPIWRELLAASTEATMPCRRITMTLPSPTVRGAVPCTDGSLLMTGKMTCASLGRRHPEHNPICHERRGGKFVTTTTWARRGDGADPCTASAMSTPCTVLVLGTDPVF